MLRKNNKSYNSKAETIWKLTVRSQLLQNYLSPAKIYILKMTKLGQSVRSYRHTTLSDNICTILFFRWLLFYCCCLCIGQETEKKKGLFSVPLTLLHERINYINWSLILFKSRQKLYHEVLHQCKITYKKNEKFHDNSLPYKSSSLNIFIKPKAK